MSRCFPFPPPGYDKKSRAEDVDILKKEKNKEKKHKKEKKEKEKREGKEKRDKDRSDEKRREKKDKKKNRDKKKEKDKDKDKDKDKTRSSEERKPLGKTESQNGEEVVKVKVNNVQEERSAGQTDYYIGNKVSQSIFFSNETKNSNPVQEMGRKIENSGFEKVEKSVVVRPKRDDGMATLVGKNSDPFSEGTEQSKKKTEDRKYNGQEVRHDERISGYSVAPSFTTTVDTGLSGISQSLEKSADRRTETNDKSRQKGDEKRANKHKDKEKKERSNDKERDKEKKKEKKAKEKMEEKNATLDRSKEINKDNLLGRHSTNTNSSQLPDSNKASVVEENLIKKRKDLEPNGFLHAFDIRPSKLPKPTKENGRILEPRLPSTSPPSERHGAINDLMLTSKERKINGVIEAHPSASAKHTFIGLDDQLTAISKRSPHSDSKYLSQVYSVPQMDELSDSDNQEWLFSSSTSRAMKPKLEASEAEGMPQVWAEAMQIESADVCALPYVIPY